jgi:hypothetical protein
VKGFGVKVQNGLIRELQTGRCEGKGLIKYEKLTIAEKEFEPIKFPFTIAVPGLITIPETSVKPVVPKAPAATESRIEEDLERIEL